MGRKKFTKRNRRYNRKAKPKKTLVVGGFPKQTMVKLRYVQEINITTSGLSNSQPFVANGLFDPYYPVGGHQPKIFDQWMLMYSHYNVLGSKARVRLTSTGGLDHVSWGICTTPHQNQMSNKTLEAVLENRYQKGYRITGSAYQNSGVRARANIDQVSYYSQKKQHGKNATSRSDLIGDVTKNPDEKTFFEIWQCPIQGVTASKTCSYLVTIDYLVLFTEPKVLAQS